MRSQKARSPKVVISPETREIIQKYDDNATLQQ